MVDSEVSGDGGDPAGVDEVTIGFNAVASLAAGKVDAATGFWNDEAVEAQRKGIPLRVFKVDEYGAPSYPELVLTTTRKEMKHEPELVELDGRRDAQGLQLHRGQPRRRSTTCSPRTRRSNAPTRRPNSRCSSPPSSQTLRR